MDKNEIETRLRNILRDSANRPCLNPLCASAACQDQRRNVMAIEMAVAAVKAFLSSDDGEETEKRS